MKGKDTFEPLWKLVCDWEYAATYENNRSATSQHKVVAVESRAQAKIYGIVCKQLAHALAKIDKKHMPARKDDTSCSR